MKVERGDLWLSASDLANHLACRHLTALDLGNAEGRWTPPDAYRPDAEVLQQRGLEHERAYLEHLERQGVAVTRLDEMEAPASAIERTLAAMRSGAEAIAQASLAHGRWFGRADLLRRVEQPSALGAWSYEALDTKLARETKAGAILQLCLYSDLLEHAQGTPPERMHVAPRKPGFPVESYRLADYRAYYRLIRRRLEVAVAADGAESTYPDVSPHCDICRWWPRCNGQRRADDHLCFVAGVSRVQMRELQSRTIATLAALAAEPLPIAWKPARGARDGYARVREQARIQLASRDGGRRLHETLPFEPGRGLALLPAPSPGDLFLDLEADPYVDEGGLEYLFGWVVADPPPAGMLALGVEPPSYHHRWALDRTGERRAFEDVMDTILARWETDPGMHVYHFGAYEPAAFKRVMGRHATREREMDRLLRSGRFVDLHAVVKQSLRAGVEEYSIKKLEPLYGFEREQSLESAGTALRALQRDLELGLPVATDDAGAAAVVAYNRDDCLSTRALRDWLESLRAEAIAAGAEIARPVEDAAAAPDRIDERELRARALAARLLEGIPDEPAERSDEQQARWRLAHLLEWHRREEKAQWWQYFDLRGRPDEELLDESAALAGLAFDRRVAAKRTVVDRYRFAPQETAIRRGDKLHLPLPAGGRFGEVEAIDLAARTVDVRKPAAVAEVHPSAVFAHDVVPTFAQAESLLRLGEWVAEHGVDAPGPWRAARDLLLRRSPRLAGQAGGELHAPEEDRVAAACRLALAMNDTTLAIQGPPGSGKTYTGARMICELVHAGRTVGICAQSHKVIRNLIDGVLAAAKQVHVAVRCIQKVGEGQADETALDPRLRLTEANPDVRAALRDGAATVAGGTAWMWARPEFEGAVDVLFVDEAGQMSLANVLAIAGCARNVVLLGDPRQLEQPILGAHPDGTELSALEHVLGGAQTIPAEQGLFLAESWRLPPEICAFTSELFYEGRLAAKATLGAQAIAGTGRYDGAGIVYVPVEHDANQSASREEVDVIGALVAHLLAADTHWTDRHGERRRLALEDILVIAPYNAQVADLAATLPQRARVGTVDKFQGQEAPVVIYSMTTSSPEDAPRGMEFLYSPNRLNVATSRAQCLCIVVGNRRLFEPDCHNPDQMRLANAFCRMRELTREVLPPMVPSA